MFIFPRYLKRPLGVNYLANMLPQICKLAETTVCYTNHCLRATTIQKLSDAGLESKEIMSVTGIYVPLCICSPTTAFFIVFIFFCIVLLILYINKAHFNWQGTRMRALYSHTGGPRWEEKLEHHPCIGIICGCSRPTKTPSSYARATRLQHTNTTKTSSRKLFP